MVLYTRVLEIEDRKKELRHTTFGSVSLFPKGTKRKVKQLTFYGWVTRLQVADIEFNTDCDSFFYLNTWQLLSK